MLNSRILRGEVVHKRLTPTKHAFSYPMTFFCFDLIELPDIAKQASIFAYNDSNLLTIRDRDYLKGTDESIKDQTDEYLGKEKAGEQTLLVTSPRYLGKAFNPVNFHLRLKGSKLLSVVAEVNNTFGDRHIYPLLSLEETNEKNTWTASCPKDFHVSPFNDLTGNYLFTFRIKQDELFMGVDLYRQNECVMKTWIRGISKPLNNRNIFNFALFHPFDTALNSFPRILWQAALLYYKRKLPVFKRPSIHSKKCLIDRDAKSHNRTII